MNDILVGSTLNSDPPIHDKTRAVTSEPLLPGSLTEVEPRLKAAVDGLIETLCARGLSYETCAKLMRDYINPSLDTTISATGQIIKFIADDPAQWDMIRADANLIPDAVEEAVRLATPIRAFTRYAIEDVDVSGRVIPKDARVIVCYASANRDPRKYSDPDRFDVTRDVHDHMGFGRGVHMCMGMHLARREIILLLEALRRRVTRFELTGPAEVAMNNTIRAYAKLPVRVHVADKVLGDGAGTSANSEQWLSVEVASREDVASDIIALTLVGVDGVDRPSFDAGAHIDVEVRSGLIRQYSLTGDPSDTSRYRLGILRDPKSRGGSVGMHTEFAAGARIRIGALRNNFPLVEAAHSILFAGGIGITPLLSMAYALEAKKASWEIHYCGRSADRLAFLRELAGFGDKVRVHLDDGPDARRLDIQAVLRQGAMDRHLFVCGPGGFMDFVVDAAKTAGWDDDCVHLERFGAEVDTDGAPFSVIARRTGKEVDVAPGETIAAKLAEIGIDVAVSCQSGVCGTCLTSVLEGTPDHRDFVQTDLEKAANNRITLYCSRSKTKRLVLDI